MKYISILALFLFSLNANIFIEVKQELGKKESNNNYMAENSLGYLGKYQFGAAALADIGLVKKSKYRAVTKIKKNGEIHWIKGNQKSFLGDSANWNNGLSKEKFLSTSESQEKAILKLLEQNLKVLKRNGIQFDNYHQIKSLLIASHLGGVGNALAYYRYGKEFYDGYGTPISKYFRAGSKLKQVKPKVKNVVYAKIKRANTKKSYYPTKNKIIGTRIIK
jgi:ssDNA-binding Zn-finger/Zn-ribbon topoisomerase 1